MAMQNSYRSHSRSLLVVAMIAVLSLLLSAANLFHLLPISTEASDIIHVLLVTSILLFVYLAVSQQKLMVADIDGLQRQHSKLTIDKEAVEKESSKQRRKLLQQIKLRDKNITALKAKLAHANAMLEERSNIDPSTELLNRNYFDSRFEAEWQRAYRNQRNLSLLLVDIDNFRQLNESYGSTTGDDVLFMVASILAQSVGRVSDVLTRFAGDQFAIILPETAIDGAEAVAEKLRQRVASAIMTNEDKKVTLTVSIGGVSVVPSVSQGWRGALIVANNALLEGKTAGGNNVLFGDPESL